MAALGSGLLLWSLVEYLLHRFVFHRFSGRLGGLHLEHHAQPRDLKFLFARPTYVLAASALLAAGLWAVTREGTQTLLVMIGLWAGYGYYESVHYRIHFTSGSRWGLGWQRRNHFRHHFQNSRRCFGVTTPLWDLILSTTASG